MLIMIIMVTILRVLNRIITMLMAMLMMAIELMRLTSGCSTLKEIVPGHFSPE